MPENSKVNSNDSKGIGARNESRNKKLDNIKYGSEQEAKAKKSPKTKPYQKDINIDDEDEQPIDSDVEKGGE